MHIIFDITWSGSGGIGRFSDEVRKRILIDKEVKTCVNPASPLNAILLSFKAFKKSETLILPGYIPPLFLFGRYIFVIHDLNHIDMVENSSLIKRLFYRLVVKRGCRKANKILTVSEFSRKSIIDWSAVDKSKVVNVGNGVDPSFNVSVISKNLGFPYFLCVSNRKLHKNESRLLLAFAKSVLPSNVRLVLTGDANTDIIREIEKYCLKGRVVFVGKVSDEDLPSLYKGSISLLFPSLYEGFGLPVIEAMACGIPVMTSNCTSLPEVAGNAALLVNPYDVNEMTNAINRLYSDKELRSDLVKKGLIRAEVYTWEKTAQRIQSVIS